MLKLFAVLLLSSVVRSEVYFEDRFEKSEPEGWVASTHKGGDAGKFLVSSGKFHGDVEKDKGIQTSEDAKFYALSRKFDKGFSNVGKDLVVQFTVKHEQSIDCGGGYVKLFDCSLDQKSMHGDSPYHIMFGPDICGVETKKVHVIFNYKGKNHLIKKDIPCQTDAFTHLYTLILKADSSYEVLIDNKKVESGNLSDDWDFLPPRKIKDPKEKKPADWDDKEKIDDPEDSKPEDWDQPEHIPDPEAAKPEDWDDEMDGEWEPSMIDNPEYKGEWKPRQIDNPAYKGKWVHPEIDNPDFDVEEAKKLGQYSEICKIGFDLWQVKSGTIFDNVLITDDIEHARKVGEETWGATKEPEKTMKEEQEKEEARKADEDTKDPTPEEEEDDEDLYDADEDKEAKEVRDEL